MQRINSVTARAHMNGSNKNGFHDNSDLPGKEATYLTPEWCNYVQEEISNAIEIFEPLQDKKDQLASIFQSYNDRFNALENRIVEETKVGDLFLTLLSFSNSDEVRKHKGYGRWEKIGNGHALVTQGDHTRPEFMQNIGGTGGEDMHQLSINELPAHKHSNSNVYNKFCAIAKDVYEANKENSSLSPSGIDGNTLEKELQAGGITAKQKIQMTEQSIGNNDLHNNIQQSITIGVWKRLP